MTRFPVRALDVARLAGAPDAGTLLVAACGSSGGGGGTAASAPAGGGGASPAGKVEVETQSGPLGPYLPDSKDMTLYMFASDTATKSTCSGKCAVYWPPVTTTGSPETSGGASGKITTIARADGSKQVVYAGHPLHYFIKDTKPGQVAGQHTDFFGGRRWVLTPAGKPITQSVAPSPDSGGGGGGGWS
jgi:predicted lipoprotein with Yx(FWY)xxD motif